MRTAEFGIMIVMVVVRASPNAARAEGENSKNPHQSLGQPRMGQYRLVLLIVINHKKPENQQSCEKTADDPAGKIEVEKCSRYRHRQQKSSREHTPPTRGCGIHCVRFGCQYQLFAGSQANFAQTTQTTRVDIQRFLVLCREQLFGDMFMLFMEGHCRR